MYHLATLFPAAKRYRLPFSRDQLMLIMLALNELRNTHCPSHQRDNRPL